MMNSNNAMFFQMVFLKNLVANWLTMLFLSIRYSDLVSIISMVIIIIFLLNNDLYLDVSLSA
jgi:hypothetical protein